MIFFTLNLTALGTGSGSLIHLGKTFGFSAKLSPAPGATRSLIITPTVAAGFPAVTATLTVILTWRTLTETLTPEQRMKNRETRRGGMAPAEVLRNAPLLAILLIAFIGQFAQGMLQATFALFGDAVLFADYSERIVDLASASCSPRWACPNF